LTANGVTIVDPSTFEIQYEQNVVETTTLSGKRRYQKLSQKRNILLSWSVLADSEKTKIITADNIEGVWTLNLGGVNYSVTSVGRPSFRRIPGTTVLWECDWELREA
jgi:hypothetical protein